jgi:hypothetical protein
MLTGGDQLGPHKPSVGRKKCFSGYQVLLWVYGLKALLFYYIFARQFARGKEEVATFNIS